MFVLIKGDLTRAMDKLRATPLQPDEAVRNANNPNTNPNANLNDNPDDNPDYRRVGIRLAWRQHYGGHKTSSPRNTP